MNRLKLFVVLLLVVAFAAIPVEAIQYPIVKARDTLYVGPYSSPTITLNGYTGDGAFAGDVVITGTLTATGGISGSVSEGTFAAGTEGAPGFQWTVDGDSGIRRSGANAMALVLNGADVVDYATTGVSVTGTLAVSGASTLAGATTSTGKLSTNGGFASDTNVFTIADTTGVISSVPTTTTSNAWVLDYTTLTSGNGLKLIGVDATLDGGKYINVYGGTNATSVWSLGESGATHIEPNVGTVPALWLDVVTQTTADALTIELDDDINTSGLFIECLGGSGHNTSVFSVGEGGAVAVAGTLAAAGNVTIGGSNVTTGATTLTGAAAFNGGISLDTSVLTVADTTGVISWVPTSTTGDAATFDGTTITSGTILKMIGVDATLNGGYYMELLGGTNATVVWTVGEGGATVITPNAATIEPLYIDGTLTTTADLLTLKAVDATLNGGLYIECLGGAGSTSKFSVAESGNVVIGGTLTVAGATTWTAALAADGGFAMDTSVFTIADTTGVISHVPTSTTAVAVTHDFSTLTSGTGIKLVGLDAKLAAGEYIEIFGGTGTTSVWSVTEGGKTTITPNVGTIEALYLDGSALTTADALTIKMVNATQAGGLFIECLDTATTKFSVAEGGNVSAAGTMTVGGTLTQTGIATFAALANLDGGLAMDTTLFTVADETGVMSHVPTNTTATAVTHDFSTTTTGTGMELIAVDATATTGFKYIDVLGGTGTTSLFEIEEGGTVTITPNAGAIEGLYIDGTALTTADALTIKTVAATLNGGLFIECLDSSTTKFSVGESGNVSMAGTCSVGSTLGVTGIQTNAAATNLDGGLAMDTDVLTIADTTGVFASTPTTTTLVATTFDYSTLTSGTGMLLVVDNDILASGYAFMVHGGSGADTNQFSIAEGGVVYTLGKVTATGGLDTGTGYSGTGATLSAAGAGQFDAALTTDGVLTGASLVCTAAGTFGGGYGSTGSTLATDGTANFDGAVTIGKVSPAAAGSLVILGTTSGGITITPIATGTAASTIVNQNVAAATITLPSATCTLPGLALTNSWGAAQTFPTAATINLTGVNAASGSLNPFDYTGTLGIMNGSDDFTLFDVNITNANHESTSNTIQVLDVASIVGDADATEIALKVGALWDYGLSSQSPATLDGSTLPNVVAGGRTMLNVANYHNTAALTGELVGIASNTRCDYASASGTVQGAKLRAGNGSDATGYALNVLTGVYVEVVKKAGSVTIDTARGLEISMDWDAATTVTNTLTGLRVELQSGATAGTNTDTYGIHVTNQNVSGAGETYDAAIAVTQVSAASAAGWTYGLDFGATIADDGISFVPNVFGIADIRLAYGETIDNTTDGEVKVSAGLYCPSLLTVTNATDTIANSTVETYYGKTVFLTHADDVAVTLPNNGAAAGSWVEFILAGDDSLAVTFSPQSADTLIAPNNATADSVTFGAGHRISATVRFVSNGSYWIAINENAGCTMTVTDAG